jgi:hypothetical protein
MLAGSIFLHEPTPRLIRPLNWCFGGGRRDQLDHAIRTACQIAGLTEVFIVVSPAAPSGEPQFTGLCLDEEDLCVAKLCAGRLPQR